MATYDRPIEATLHVHLDNGETWPATSVDVAKFGLLYATRAYGNFRSRLIEALNDAGLDDRDITNAALNPVRYLAELVLTDPNDGEVDDSGVLRAIGEIERILRAADQLGDEVCRREGSLENVVVDRELRELLFALAGPKLSAS